MNLLKASILSAGILATGAAGAAAGTALEFVGVVSLTDAAGVAWSEGAIGVFSI